MCLSRVGTVFVFIDYLIVVVIAIVSHTHRCQKQWEVSCMLDNVVALLLLLKHGLSAVGIQD